MKIINCRKCGKDITKRYELTQSDLCVECKSEEDDFKWKMKEVGWSDEPSIAKTKKEWDKLKKQKKLKDI
jgi:hypothetical protein